MRSKQYELCDCVNCARRSSRVRMLVCVAVNPLEQHTAQIHAIDQILKMKEKTNIRCNLHSLSGYNMEQAKLADNIVQIQTNAVFQMRVFHFSINHMI